MSRLIFVSHGFPVLLKKKDDGSFDIYPRDSGFASGLESFYKGNNNLWFGYPGIDRGDLSKKERSEIPDKLRSCNCLPIFLKKKDREKYLEGFSHRTIWPLFHYFTQNAIFSEDFWAGYVKVNRLFADTIVPYLKEGDKIWIHGFQLLLLPQMIRNKKPGVSIGFFLHIPFPSYEIFRRLPWRKEILEGMLGADLIGFHTYDYVRHFMSCVRRLLGYDSTLNRLQLEERILKVDFFPLGVDYNKIHQTSKEITETRNRPLYKQLLNQNLIGGGKKLILSIDRLDYTKGIPLRLNAFELFFLKYPEYLEKVSLLLYVTPSRESVEQYKLLKRQLDELTGKINSRFGILNWMPVWYFYRSIDFDELIELYTFSDIALITPVIDGMNLIAKEFIAAKCNMKGVLILSEMAGASKEMGEAIIVNPNNLSEIADAIKCALEMPEDEQIERNRLLQDRLERYNEEKWANDFIRSIEEVKKIQKIKLARKLTDSIFENIRDVYTHSQDRIILLDYDGTLMGFNKDPQMVMPDKELLSILKNLTGDEKNRVIIISGRDKETLGKWFPPPWNIGFIAEHGVWSRDPGGDWGMMEQIDKNWMNTIRPILEFYVDRTPRSFIEQKNYSLVWHYRNTDPDLGIMRSWELKDELQHMVANLNLEIMDGDMVIEIKNSGINKGRAAMLKIGDHEYGFILALGDDWTDEYTFGALPERAHTIKVGTSTTKAKYYVESVKDVRRILKKLAGIIKE